MNTLKTFLAILFITLSIAPSRVVLAAERPMCVMVDEERFYVSRARTPEQMETGLMGKTKLKPSEGMLFEFGRLQDVTFWMKGCKIPLDMLFFAKDRLVGVVDSAPVCTDDSGETCTRYKSPIPVNYVLEVKAGTRVKKHFTSNSRLKPCNPGQDFRP